jgi:hypothetical protein
MEDQKKTLPVAQIHSTRLILLVLLIFLAGCSALKHSATGPLVNTPTSEIAGKQAVSTFQSEEDTGGDTGNLLATKTPGAANTPTLTYTLTVTTTQTPTATAAAKPTKKPKPSKTSTSTKTATITLTPTITPTPNPPTGIVSVAQANCRYGPGAAYLYKFGLYQGIPVEIQGRTDRGDWVYVLPKWYESGCWIKASLLDVTGDIFSVDPYYGVLPYSEYYPPPVITGLTRKGDEVWIAWEDVGMTADKYRGYLIEAWLCVDGEIVFTPVHIDGTFVILNDEAGCSEPSRARIYTAEKHGYSKWRNIGWPQNEGTVTPTAKP